MILQPLASCHQPLPYCVKKNSWCKAAAQCRAPHYLTFIQSAMFTPSRQQTTAECKQQAEQTRQSACVNNTTTSRVHPSHPQSKYISRSDLFVVTCWPGCVTHPIHLIKYTRVRVTEVIKLLAVGAAGAVEVNYGRRRDMAGPSGG